MEKFKVGDWVYENENLVKVQFIDECGNPCLLDGNWTVTLFEPKKWQPKEGEWCWYNKKYFIKVKNIKDEQIYFSSLDGMYINDWDYLCKFEPFIGELPTFLKDNA